MSKYKAYKTKSNHLYYQTGGFNMDFFKNIAGNWKNYMKDPFSQQSEQYLTDVTTKGTTINNKRKDLQSQLILPDRQFDGWGNAADEAYTEKIWDKNYASNFGDWKGLTEDQKFDAWKKHKYSKPGWFNDTKLGDDLHQSGAMYDKDVATNKKLTEVNKEFTNHLTDLGGGIASIYSAQKEYDKQPQEKFALDFTNNKGVMRSQMGSYIPDLFKKGGKTNKPGFGYPSDIKKFPFLDNVIEPKNVSKQKVFVTNPKNKLNLNKTSKSLDDLLLRSNKEDLTKEEKQELQRQLNATTGSKLKDDGLIGKKTSAAIKKYKESITKDTNIVSSKYDTKEELPWYRKRFYENLNPYNYDTPNGENALTRSWKTLINNEKEPAKVEHEELLKQYDEKGKINNKTRREDAQRVVVGLPQARGTFKKPTYEPLNKEESLLQKIGLKDEVPTYEFTDPGIQQYLKEVSKHPEFFDEKGVMLSRDNAAGVMGKFKISKGKDARGEYLSYYDKYDFEPFRKTKIPVIQDISLPITDSFDTYGRYYVGDNSVKDSKIFDREIEANRENLLKERDQRNQSRKISDYTTGLGTPGIRQSGGEVPTSPLGLYQYPGQMVNVPSGKITMRDINYPVLALPNNNKPEVMYPNQEYEFQDSDSVLEVPMMQAGGGEYPNTDYNDLDDEDVKNQIKGHEGAVIDKYGKHVSYADSRGFRTIGYGHLWKKGDPTVLTQKQAEDLFNTDYRIHKKHAENIPGYQNATSNQKKALINLTFNMGSDWYKKFPKFTKAFTEGDSVAAAEQLQNSKWAKQVGKRSKDVIDTFLSDSNPQPIKQDITQVYPTNRTEENIPQVETRENRPTTERAFDFLGKLKQQHKTFYEGLDFSSIYNNSENV